MKHTIVRAAFLDGLNDRFAVTNEKHVVLVLVADVIERVEHACGFVLNNVLVLCLCDTGELNHVIVLCVSIDRRVVEDHGRVVVDGPNVGARVPFLDHSECCEALRRVRVDDARWRRHVAKVGWLGSIDVLSQCLQLVPQSVGKANRVHRIAQCSRDRVVDVMCKRQINRRGLCQPNHTPQHAP